MPAIARPSSPRFEQRTDAGLVLGLGTGTPRLSWTVESAPADYLQRAYELEVVTNDECRRFHVLGNDQVLVPWPAPSLTSRQTASVRVRVTDGREWSEWSAFGSLEVGLLSADDWTGRFISPMGIGALGEPAPIIRTRFGINSPIIRARLYCTAHGIYVPRLNGLRVGTDLFAPGWTAYEHRLAYQTYDITDLLQQGENSFEALLGNGWYRGRLGWKNETGHYGDRLALLAQLEVLTEDGQVQVVATDSNWRSVESAVDANDFYDGQVTDLRRIGDVRTEHPTEVVAGALPRLFASDAPPVRALHTRAAERVWTSPSGRLLVDFGQNLVGWVRLKVRGANAGTMISLRHAEVLEEGELALRPLRSAQVTDMYVLAGGDAALEPELTFHGFRYADITGLDALEPEDIEAIVIGTDLPRTGWFESSHDMLNRLHENVLWSARGNFLSIPTDCPQRDERLGWTGDAQVFAPTATFLFDCAAFLANWLQDLAADQYPDGSVPFVIPDILGDDSPTAAAWGDAATVIPNVLWQRYADARVLQDQFESMRAWVERVAHAAGPDRLWTGGFQFGDWLDPTAPPQQPGLAKANPDVVATAHFARSAQLLADAATTLGRIDDAERYGSLAQEVRAAFAAAFVDDDGHIVSDAQTVYAIAIVWGLIPSERQLLGAGRRLAELVRESGFHISTGFVGTPVSMDALAQTGHVDEAFGLLLQTKCPSWLYPVTMGATTIWERWDSMLPDGSVNPGEMTSFNHYALGAVADWLHRTLAGLAPLDPGYRRVRVQPTPSAELWHASARHITPYGEFAVAWIRESGLFTLDIRVPVGACAEVHLPNTAQPLSVAHGVHRWSVPDPC